MNIKAKGIRLIQVCLMILTIFTACSTKAISSDSTSHTDSSKRVLGIQKPIKLKAYLMYSDLNRKELFDTYYSVNVKKELPNFDVEFEVAEGTAYLDKLRIYNASGYMPDVYWGNNLPINSGNSLDLTDIIKNDGFEAKYTDKGALIPWRNGRIYTISAGNDLNYIPVVFYNKDVFSKAGITVPKSMMELIMVARTLKQKGYIPMTAPGAWILCETFMQDLFLGLDPTFAFNIMDGKAKFSDPTGIKAFKELKTMIDVGMFPSNMATIDYGSGIQLFKEKKAAMCYVPTWEVGSFATDSNIDFFGLPGVGSDTDKNVNVWGSAQNGFSVFSHSKNIDAAVKLAQWFVMQDAAYFVTVKKNKISIDIGIEIKNVPALTQKTFDRIKGATESKTAIMALSGPTDSIFQAEMGKFLTGQITPETFAEALDQSFAENDR